MEKRTKKMLLAILMIISVLAADFFVLGSGIITYASELSSETNNTNVEFSVYFKNGENREDSIQKSIKDEDVKLYAEIKVKNEGYLTEGTVIELENSNFNLKNEILESNTYINSIEGNKVNLKQINAGETIELELGIELAIAEKITTDYLSQTSTVKMIGTYVYSKAEDGESIRTDKVVSVNYQPDETTGAELNTDIITNTVLSVNGTNKRIVQLLIKSRLTNNEYPVKQTRISADIPEINGETPEVSAMAINELATNGTTEINSVTTEEGKVKITLNNDPDENNQITWKKNIYDEIVITYIYPETVEASDVCYMDSSLGISVYNSEESYMAVEHKNQAIGETVPESNNVIMGRTEITTEELYKGNIYANIGEQYKTNTSIVITNPNVVDEIVVNEGPDAFGTAESELTANTKYISTEINLEKMLAIVGQDGNIEIKNGETVTLINKETPVDTNGNVVINHENGTSELYITTSKPVVAGILELTHTKAITENSYTRAQLQEVKTLIAKGSVEGTITVDKEKQSVISKATESGVLELKETISKAELTIENNKQTLSTTQANEVTLGITLVTDGVQYDLYKNPKISLKFPEAVENVQLISTPSKQNADEFTVSVGEYNATKKTIQIDLQGEQTVYPDSEFTQAYIQLNLNVTLSSLAIAKTDKIMMAYINENAIQYEGGRTDYGIVEQVVEISAPSQLIKMFNLSSNENTSTTETILQQIKDNQAGKTLEFGISLINNKDSDISNLKILGKLPTTGNVISGVENTLETILTGITAENSAVYYTENSSATVDLEDTANGWTQDLSTLTNAKLYLIKVDSLARGETYNATLNVQIPNTIINNALSYTQYGVIYNTVSETEVKESSRKIGLASSLAATIKTQITAQVGQDILSDGDVVKEGEVIKYTVTVSNNGTSTLENVQLKLDVPEGTTYVRPTYITAVNSYYEEVVDEETLAQLTNITIEELSKTPYIIEYEVRVNKGAANTEILNNSSITYNESIIKVNEIKNIIEESNIRVTAKRQTGQQEQLLPNKEFEYIVYVENISNSTINNLKLKINAEGFNIETINDSEEISTIEINEIEPKSDDEEANVGGGIGIRSFVIKGRIDGDAEQVNIYAIASDSENRESRSNLFTEAVPYVNVEANMTCSQNNTYIQEGDTVKYSIVVKNTGDVEENIRIRDVVPDNLEIQSILENNEISREASNELTISNDVERVIQLKPQEQITMDIVTKVRYISDIYNGTVITNSAEVEVIDSMKTNTQVISHILRTNETTESDIENVISGFAWNDTNENGKKDADEELLPNINVKLYDVSTNMYALDEDGTEINTITNYKGEYTINKVKNGSYLVIFEYDTEKYELTELMAEGVDSSLNSKAILKYIEENREEKIITAIQIDNLAGNVFNMNIGLKDKIEETEPEEPTNPSDPTEPEEPTDPSDPTNPEEPTNPSDPTDPEEPTNPSDPTEPEEPTNPSDPTEPEEPTNPSDPTDPEEPTNPNDPTEPEDPINPSTPVQPTDTKTIKGFAWLDSNEDGKKSKDESYLSGIKVRLYDISAKDYFTDEYGKIVEKTTDDNGKYEFDNLVKGNSYIVIFEYNTEEYEIITQDSNVIVKKINIDGQELTVAVTNTINVQKDISNINIGLKENLKFDLELNKYISKIVVQTSEKTKSYDYEGKTLGKVEIHRKQIQGALVVLEYTITVKNTGEIAGCAKNIVDYVPSGLTFSSELNSDWYLSGNNLYTKSLENVELKPGEEKEVKLILTKAMTNENVGLINNRAEIYQDYNKDGEADIDSTPNNQAQNEDDFGTTDVIIQVATGGSIIAYIILAIINIVLIYVAIRIMIKNGIIEIKTKEERR